MLCELHNQLISGKSTSISLTEAYLKKIKDTNPSLNSFITVNENMALRQAEEADKRIKSSKDITPLTGIPIGIKDNLVIRGVRTTCGSKILGNYIPPYTATAVDKLEKAGAVIVGKLNMDEFAMGSSNEHSFFGPVKNPHDLTRVPGGSSGGAAAAVAADQCAAALGTDTGGSIRQPASLCGVVGLKPTYGRVSRYGLVAFASSLDQIGPITKDVQDAAIVLNTIAGHDPKDSTSLDISVPDYTKAQGISGIRIGIPREYFVEGMDPELRASIEKAIKGLKDAGAKIIDVSLPNTRYALPCYYIIAPAEASANLARYDGIRYGHRSKSANDLKGLYELSRSEGLGEEVSLRIMVGTYVLSSGYYEAYYKKASQVRTLIKSDFVEAFKKVDVLITPASPTPAFKLGEKMDDPIKMYLSDIFTIPVNLAGLPAMSVPCGKTKGGLPIGMQIIGPHLGEERILQVGYAFEITNDQ